jgi:hypothetical protein
MPRESHLVRPGRSAVRCLAAVLALSGCGGGSSPTAPTNTSSPPLSSATGTVVVHVPNEGFNHVTEGSSITYQHNPPASGPHYPVWARYAEYGTPLARGYWVHNLEHGAVVFLYRPDAASATIDALRDVYRSLPPDLECGLPRALLTPDPLMTRPIAVVAWDWVLDSDVVEPSAIADFVQAHRGNGREDICEGGTRP